MLSRETERDETFAFLAISNKRQRSKVKLCTLDPAERQEFERAKAKEVSNWLQRGTVARMLRHQLAPEQILRCG